MRYQNLTPEKLAEMRAKKPTMTSDGAWLNWPPTEPKRKNPKTSRTASYIVARAFKPGSGRYS